MKASSKILKEIIKDLNWKLERANQANQTNQTNEKIIKDLSAKLEKANESDLTAKLEANESTNKPNPVLSSTETPFVPLKLCELCNKMSETRELSCAHRFCKPCLYDYYYLRLQRRSDPKLCPKAGCHMIVTNDLIESFLENSELEIL